MNGHQPRRDEQEARAIAARRAQAERIIAARRAQAERIIAAVEREMRLQVGTRPPGAPMATRIHAGRSALVTAASVALVGACVALALWLGSL